MDSNIPISVTLPTDIPHVERMQSITVTVLFPSNGESATASLRMDYRPLPASENVSPVPGRFYTVGGDGPEVKGFWKRMPGRFGGAP